VQALDLSLDKWLYTAYEAPYFAVYHSVLVTEESDVYVPVREYLHRLDCTLVVSGQQQDPRMMFGEGVWKIFQIGGKA
jgi:hypothetical protein